MYKGPHVKYPLCLSDFLREFEFSRQSFEKCSNIKFNENPSSGSRVVPFGLTDRRFDTTRLTVIFSNFANVPKN